MVILVKLFENKKAETFECNVGLNKGGKFKFYPKYSLWTPTVKESLGSLDMCNDFFLCESLKV